LADISGVMGSRATRLDKRASGNTDATMAAGHPVALFIEDATRRDFNSQGGCVRAAAFAGAGASRTVGGETRQRFCTRPGTTGNEA